MSQSIEALNLRSWTNRLGFLSIIFLIVVVVATIAVTIAVTIAQKRSSERGSSFS